MESPQFTVLAVDDDPTQLELLQTYVESIESITVEYLSAESFGEARQILSSGETVDLVLSDYRLPDGSGYDVLTYVKELNPLIKVVVMTAFESVEDAVEILKHGGDDYLVKPTPRGYIEHLIIRLFEQQSLERENRRVDERIEEEFEQLPILYRSRAMQQVLNLISRSAESDATVMITGESGTGKELLARLIHQSSPRSTEPFVTVNIAALPESLMESELFGYVKGAFTGADRERMGRFEEADGGTLFIDEVGDIPPSIQVKLLRVIQFGQIQRIGENSTRTLSVRIITATNRDLERMVGEGDFRADLYWRINVIRIDVPPLRSRKADIPVLADHFIRKYNEKNGRSVSGISREAIDLLMRHTFPGNVRELENIIERAVIMARSPLLSCADLPLDSAVPSETAEHSGDVGSNGEGYDEQLQSFETRLIRSALEETGGNQSGAARLLRISERRLRSRMKILGLQKTEEETP